MGKIIRRVIAVLLTVTAIIIAVLPAKSAEATSVHGDYEYDGNTIVKYLGNDTEVTLPNWVTTVGKEAFAGNKNIQKIVLPDSVRTIDFAAFEDCSNLLIAEIPESVRTIGSSAFSGCTNLYSVSLPSKLDSLGSGVFAGCTSLASVPVTSGNLYYACDDGVIYTKDGKELIQYLAGRPHTSYTMPSSVEKIDEYAFWGAKDLNNVEISSGVNRIPEYAFSYCDGLTSVDLPDSVETLSAFSFADCGNLQYITIPDSVGFIDDRAFSMTKGAKLRFVDDNGNTLFEVDSENVDAYGNGTNESNPQEPDGKGNMTAAATQSSMDFQSEIPSLPADEVNSDIDADDGMLQDTYNPSFSGQDGWISEIENQDYSENIIDGQIGTGKIIGGNVLVMIPSDTRAKGFGIEEVEAEDEYEVSTANTNISPEDMTQLDGVFADYSGNESDVIIPGNIVTIGSRAFYKNPIIETVQLPAGVLNINDFAFARSNISSIDIPEGVERIGYAAFYNCPSLNKVSIPSTVENIELGAFDGTLWLDEWYRDDTAKDFLIVGDNILLKYKGNAKDVIIPADVKHIAAGAFEDNKNIESVTMPGNVLTIGEDAFNGCNNLRVLTFSDTLTTIEDRAFKDTNMSTVVIPDSVTGIGLGAFDTTGNNSSLKSVIFVGNDMPNVIYNNTATRLSADKLRTKAFEGVPNAIVEADCDINSGTMLDPRFYGFSGQIYSVDNPELSEVSNSMTLVRITNLPDRKGNVTITPRATIGGVDYVVSNVRQGCFDYYTNWPSWCDFKPSEFMVDGNSSEALDTLIERLKKNVKEVNNDKTRKGINVNLTGECFGGVTNGYAAIPDNNDYYVLNITQDSSMKNLIDAAYSEAIGAKPDGDFVYLSLDMYDKTSTMPIHKLGVNKMELAIPLPLQLVGKEGVKVGCLDDNGLFTEVASNVENDNGLDILKFVAAHCSPYVVYCKSVVVTPEVASMPEPNQVFMSEDGTSVDYYSEIEGVTSEINMDEMNFGNRIVNTLHRQVGNSIEVKWFVVVILICMAGILVVYKPSKKTVIK